MNKILIIGGNSFLAKNLIPVLNKRFLVTAVARKFDYIDTNIEQKIISSYSNESELESLLNSDYHCIIYCCGMLNLSRAKLFEANVRPFETLIRILEKKSLTKTALIKVSASGISRDSSDLVDTLILGELALKNSQLKHWTIIRPSLIYGNSDHKNLTSLAKFLKYSPIIATPLRNQVFFQPVLVQDIARAIHKLIDSYTFHQQTIEMSGPHPIDIVDAVDLIAKIQNKKILKISIDLNLVKLAVKILSSILPDQILPTEQVLHLSAETPWDIKAFNQLLENRQTPYEEGFKTLIT
jgi:nucleoside-diphosphate-sugar epimerase